MPPQENQVEFMEMAELFHRFGKRFGVWNSCPELRRSEWGALFCIFRSQDGENGVKTSQISTKMEVSPPALTPTLNQLEKKGLIKRIPSREDRRTVYLKVTPEGMEVCREQRKRLEKRFQELSGYLGEKDSEELIRLLGRILSYCEEREKEQVDGER